MHGGSGRTHGRDTTWLTPRKPPAWPGAVGGGQQPQHAVPDLHAGQRRRGLPGPGHAAHLRFRPVAGRAGAGGTPGCAWAPSRPTSSPPTSYAQLGVVGGYCYLNASLIRLFGERAPGLSWQLMDEQFFGAQPGIPPYQEEPGDVRPDLTRAHRCHLRLGAVRRAALRPDRAGRRHAGRRSGCATERPDLAALSDAELVARYRRAHRCCTSRPLRAPPVRHLHGHGARSASSSGVCVAVGQPGPAHGPHRRCRRRRLRGAVDGAVGARPRGGRVAELHGGLRRRRPTG